MTIAIRATHTIRFATWRAGRDGVAHLVQGAGRLAAVVCGIPAWDPALDGPRRSRCATCAEMLDEAAA